MSFPPCPSAWLLSVPIFHTIPSIGLGFLFICWVWNSFSSWSIYSWPCINSCSSTSLSVSLEWAGEIIFQWWHWLFQSGNSSSSWTRQLWFLSAVTGLGVHFKQGTFDSSCFNLTICETLCYYIIFLFFCLFVWLVGCCCVRVCRQDYIFIVFCQTCIENTLNITWQCVLTAQRANHVLVCIKRSVAKRSTEMILPLYSALMRPHLSAASSSGAPNTRKVLTWWSEFEVGPWGCS